METMPPSKATVSLSDITTPSIVEDRELEILMIASIQTLKRGTEKFGKDEVLNLVKGSLDDEIVTETFEELLESFQSQSIKLNAARNREYLSLPKETQMSWGGEGGEEGWGEWGGVNKRKTF